MKFLPAIWKWTILFFLTGTLMARESTDSSGPLIVSFKSGDKMLLGYLFRPEGQGPFPAVIFHHGYARSLMQAADIGQWQKMAKKFTSNGYIFFLPDRHPEMVETFEYSISLQQQLKSKKKGIETAAKQQQVIEKLDIVQRDVSSAFTWLKQQPDVDPKRISVGGHLAGAVNALYDGAQTPDVSALVIFSPAVLKWKFEPVMRGVLLEAVRKSTAPIFLIFAENNQSPEAAEALGRELENKGKPNQMKIYSHSSQAEKGLIPHEPEVWGDDVIAFLRKPMKRQKSEVERR
jgi:dienelactone hydrolase